MLRTAADHRPDDGGDRGCFLAVSASASAPGARSWTVKMTCAMEGTDYKQTQTLALAGETLGEQRLTITVKGKPTVYRRCGLSKRGAEQRS